MVSPIMTKPLASLNRRDFLRISAATAAVLHNSSSFATTAPQPDNLYATLLQSWCDGLLAHQVNDITSPALHGAILCPACGLIHGRIGDSVYPLLRVAHTTGQSRYLDAALLAHNWSERNVSRTDGSWINDVVLSQWKGITVFHSIALAEALHHHGELLDPKTRQQWTDRLAAAAHFLDGFISIDTGNVNYPITASYAFALCAHVLEQPRYTDRARKLAHQAIECITPAGLIYGEGHPIQKLSPKHCRPVDLGYNVEESLPALALYSLATNDHEVQEIVVHSLRTHMEFMLPNGAWDNSWGTRNYKWSWWGSRTSDGCHPAFALMSDRDPAFLEVAHRNLQLMSACTHDNVLYGGPDYFAHGDFPCIHHNFTHAKALATVLDRGPANPIPSAPAAIPRDAAYGVRSFTDINTHLAAIGEWRATATGYDWEYTETVQSGSGGSGGGHASGGALTMLYHRNLGPLLTASMTQYKLVEIANQQVERDGPHMTLTPRIECATSPVLTSLSDLAATLTANATPDRITMQASGRLLGTADAPQPQATYKLSYTFTADSVEIAAAFTAASPLTAPVHFILPVIANSTEPVDRLSPGTAGIRKPNGTLLVHTDSPQGFEEIPSERTFNLVPGFECVPLRIKMQSGQTIRIRLEAKA